MSPRSDVLVIATGHALSLARLRGGAVLAEHHMALRAGHAEALLPALAALVGENTAGIGAVVVETGPGSFTGLRVGLAAARALGLAWGVPVSGIGSAALVAAEARAAGAAEPLLVALAAPRGQVWLQDADAPAAEARALWPEAAAVVARAWCTSGGAVTGSAAQMLVGGSARPETVPRAAAAAALDPAALGPPSPVYVRAPDAASAPAGG
jgi:tRNA threonylcarbamoyladenosine biosynthesis protein TsaB